MENISVNVRSNYTLEFWGFRKRYAIFARSAYMATLTEEQVLVLLLIQSIRHTLKGFEITFCGGVFSR